MKKVLSNIFGWIITVIFILFIILYFLISTPINYVKYKTSPYYKKTRRKYSFSYDASSEKFKFCNEIIKNNLPVRIMESEEDVDPILSGCFVYDKTLILIIPPYFEYDKESQQWVDLSEAETEDSIMSLDEYIDMEIKNAKEKFGDDICDDAIVLISSDDVADLKLAKEESRFLIYEDSRVETVRRFCEKR